MELFRHVRKTGAWVEINLDKIGMNLKRIKESLNADTGVICVVKANAYGHGAVEVSKYLETQSGVDYLAVARIEEALELRRNNISLPILCMGYVYPGDIEEAIRNDITMTVYNLEMAEEINKCAISLEKKSKVHIKIDSGMSRLGFLVNNESLEEIKVMNAKLRMLDIEGIYTHFAKADEEDKSATVTQVKSFNKMVTELERFGINIRYKHVSNSAASLDMKELGFNTIRLGISLYGYYPSEEVSKDIELKPAMALKTIVTNVKTIPKDTGVSYGYTYVTNKETKIATLAIGYADGYPRSQENPRVYLNGVLVNIVGRVCMDQSMVEIPEGLNIEIGDEVVVMGDVPGIRVEDIAKKINTINYEVLCMISRRVVRYYQAGDVITVTKYI